MSKPKSNKKNNFYKDISFCVLDFETTGLSAFHDRVIEIGIVKVKNGKIKEQFSSFINPGRFIPDFISNLTGIRYEDLSDAPAFKDIALKVKSFICDSILVAHNLKFDYSFLANEFQRSEIDLPALKTLCTVKLSKYVFPELKSKSLENVLKHLHIKHKNVHRALGDAQATAKLLIKELELLSNSEIQNIDELIARINSTKNKNLFSLQSSLDKNFVPQNPGVYFFKNKFDKIIYIGKAKSLKNRIDNHLQESAPIHSQRILKKAFSLEIKETNSELTALISEAEYIKKFNPKLNHLLKKYPKSYFLKFDFKTPFPKPEKTNDFQFDGNDYFGPFVKRNDVEILIETINKSFELRECPDKTLFKGINCYLKDIDRCTAPCENKNENIYKEELGKVYDFLAGNNSFIIDRLLKKMKSFANNKKFEQAAEIRDTMNVILKNISRLALIREPINKTNALIKINSRIKNDLLLIREGRVIILDYDGIDQHKFFQQVNEFYDRTIFSDNNISNKDLERIRIILSWLIKNHTSAKIFYLNNFTDLDSLLKVVLA